MNSRTSRPRSPTSASTVTAASVPRVIIDSSVDFPTPEPAKMPMRWPRPHGMSVSSARTPSGSGSSIMLRVSGCGACVVDADVRHVCERRTAVDRAAEPVEHPAEERGTDRDRRSRRRRLRRGRRRARRAARRAACRRARPRGRRRLRRSPWPSVGRRRATDAPIGSCRPSTLEVQADDARDAALHAAAGPLRARGRAARSMQLVACSIDRGPRGRVRARRRCGRRCGTTRRRRCSRRARARDRGRSSSDAAGCEVGGIAEHRDVGRGAGGRRRGRARVRARARGRSRRGRARRAARARGRRAPRRSESRRRRPGLRSRRGRLSRAPRTRRPRRPAAATSWPRSSTWFGALSSMPSA